MFDLWEFVEIELSEMWGADMRTEVFPNSFVNKVSQLLNQVLIAFTDVLSDMLNFDIEVTNE